MKHERCCHCIQVVVLKCRLLSMKINEYLLPLVAISHATRWVPPYYTTVRYGAIYEWTWTLSLVQSNRANVCVYVCVCQYVCWMSGVWRSVPPSPTPTTVHYWRVVLGDPVPWLWLVSALKISHLCSVGRWASTFVCGTRMWMRLQSNANPSWPRHRRCRPRPRCRCLYVLNVRSPFRWLLQQGLFTLGSLEMIRELTNKIVQHIHTIWFVFRSLAHLLCAMSRTMCRTFTVRSVSEFGCFNTLKPVPCIILYICTHTYICMLKNALVWYMSWIF